MLCCITEPTLLEGAPVGGTEASERGGSRLTLGNLNGASADPTDDITQQVFFDFILGKPAQYRQMSEQQAFQSQHRASNRHKQRKLSEELRSSGHYFEKVWWKEMKFMLEILQFCTWRVSSLSLQQGIVDFFCQTLRQSLAGYMPACQSHNVGGPGAWLQHFEKY